jgi:hypothetical protein
VAVLEGRICRCGLESIVSSPLIKKRFSFEMGSECESRCHLRPRVMRDRTRGSYLSFFKLFPRNQNQRPQEQELNQFFKPAGHRKKTPKSKMKLTLLIVLIVLASLGTALPIIFSLPAAPALLSKNKKLPANSPAPYHQEFLSGDRPILDSLSDLRLWDFLL